MNINMNGNGNIFDLQWRAACHAVLALSLSLGLSACSSGEREEGITVELSAVPLSTAHHHDDATEVKHSGEEYATFRRSDGMRIDLEEGLLNLVPLELVECQTITAQLQRWMAALSPISAAYAHGDGGGEAPEAVASVVEGEATDLGTLTAAPGQYCGVVLALQPGSSGDLEAAIAHAGPCYYPGTQSLSDEQAEAAGAHECIEVTVPAPTRQIRLNFTSPVTLDSDHRHLALTIAMRYEEWFDGLDMSILANDSTQQSAFIDNVAASMQVLTEDEQLVNVAFKLQVNGEEAVCNQVYEGLGNTAQPMRMAGFRYYLSDVSLENDSGSEYVTLATKPNAMVYEDATHNVALMGHAQGCDSTVPVRNFSLAGQVKSGAYDRMCFSLGVPFELNHSDVATAPTPLNVTALSWSWLSGRIFLRFDGLVPQSGVAYDGDTSTLNQNFFVHLGSTGCSNGSSDFGSPPDEACAYPNRPRICLAYGELEQGHAVVADIAPVVAEMDVTVNTPDTAPGCMSFPGDPECSTIVPRLGLDFALNPPALIPAQDQMLLTVEAE